MPTWVITSKQARGTPALSETILSLGADGHWEEEKEEGREDKGQKNGYRRCKVSFETGTVTAIQ